MEKDSPEFKEMQEWLDAAVKSSGPKIESSGCFLTLLTEGYAKDPLAALQFGIAVLLDKPIYLAVPKGMCIPENVKKMARGIAYYNPDDPEGIQAATVDIVNMYQKESEG